MQSSVYNIKTSSSRSSQIFVKKMCESYYRRCRDINNPYGVLEFVAVALAGRRKKTLSCYGSKSEARYRSRSEPASYQTSYQARYIDRTIRAKERRGVLSQTASQRTLVNTHLTTSIRFCFLPDIKRVY